MDDTTDTEERIDRLEAQLHEQREIIEEQREQIAQLQDKLNGTGTTVTRRTALSGLGVLGGLGLLTGTATADPQGQVGTSADPLTELHTDTVIFHDTNSDDIGFRLTESSEGTLTVQRDVTTDSQDRYVFTESGDLRISGELVEDLEQDVQPV